MIFERRICSQERFADPSTTFFFFFPKSPDLFYIIVEQGKYEQSYKITKFFLKIKEIFEKSLETEELKEARKLYAQKVNKA